MRIILSVAGALLVVLGLIWLLQGLNVLPGSFMTGQSFWAITGAICLVLGVALLVAGLRRRAG